MQNKLNSLEKTAQLVGLKINGEKTKLLRTNIKQDPQFTIYGTNIEDVREFTYLGSKVSQSGGTDEDIISRIKKARQAFAILKPVWKASNIAKSTKLKIFNSNVKAVLLYGSETWRTTLTTSAKIQTFINRCLRQILQIKWFDKVPNTELWTRTNQKPMDVQIRRRKWRWVGHTLRKEPSNITKQALEWNPQGKRKRGRPKQTWRRSLHQDMSASNFSWNETKACAKDRRRWKNAVEALCFARSQEA